MKLIIAIVKPFTIDRIITALESIENFPGITVSDGEGFGRRLIKKIDYDPLDPFKEVKCIEIACNEDMVETIVSTIKSQAHTGKIGDGIILVLPIEDAVFI